MSFLKNRNFVFTMSLVISSNSLLAQNQLPERPEKPNKKAIENTIETAEKATQPLRNKENPHLEMLRKRALEAQKRKAALLEKIASGEVTPWQDFLDTQAKLVPAIEKLQLYTLNFHREENPQKKETLRKVIMELLQPVGPYLQPADYQAVDLTLTKEQHAELTQLQAAERYPTDATAGENTITPMNSTLVYTLTHFKVPIQLKSAPDTTIYLNAKGGGMFENGLSLMTLTTDKDGNASTHWITQGDSSGSSLVEVTSPHASNHITYEIETVKLSFLSIPDTKAYLEQLKQMEKLQQNTELLKSKQQSTDLPNSLLEALPEAK